MVARKEGDVSDGDKDASRRRVQDRESNAELQVHISVSESTECIVLMPNRPCTYCRRLSFNSQIILPDNLGRESLVVADSFVERDCNVVVDDLEKV